MADIETVMVPHNDLTIFNVNGDLTADEIIQKVEEFYNSQPTRLVLWYLADASLSGISVEGFTRIVSSVKTFSEKRKGGKTAIVAPEDVNFGLGRMFEAFALGEELPGEYRTFRSVEDATLWLALKK